MPRPREGYKLANGTPVPGVSSVISNLGGGDALTQWAWKLGRDGKVYKDVLALAAEIGTLAHAKVEAIIKGEPEPFSENAEIEGPALKSRDAYNLWRAKNTDKHIVTLEVPMVSEQHRFGGTPDAGMFDEDRFFDLLDWKSGRVYTKHYVQVGGYAILLEECRGLRVRGATVVSLDKLSGKPKVHRIDESQLAQAKQLFLRNLDAYNLFTTLDK